MSEKKTINIHPDLLNGGNNTTRKQKKEIKNKIQIKNKIEKKPKKISTIKRNILKMIRNQQIEKNRKSSSILAKQEVIPTESHFKNEFNDTLEYLSTLVKDTEDKSKNHTIRRYPMSFSEISEKKEEIDIPVSVSMEIKEPIQLNPYIIPPPPKYGCMKNGNLPTYRNFMNYTRKATTPPIPTIGQQHYEKKLEENIKDLSKIQQIHKYQSSQNMLQPESKKKHYKIPKQKRIIRRTFYVGRSKVYPKISVLVANKTIRSNTQMKTQQLKNIPMTEVKHYLLKNGFIKVGTNAPNDVLREMYENTQMICGEVKNHNPENLLYNYFNATGEI
jgi:hypothetical protein